MRFKRTRSSVISRPNASAIVRAARADDGHTVPARPDQAIDPWVVRKADGGQTGSDGMTKSCAFVHSLPTPLVPPGNETRPSSLTPPRSGNVLKSNRSSGTWADHILYYRHEPRHALDYPSLITYIVARYGESVWSDI